MTEPQARKHHGARRRRAGSRADSSIEVFAEQEVARGFLFIPRLMGSPKQTFFNVAGLIGLIGVVYICYEGIIYGIQSPTQRKNYKPALLYQSVDRVIGFKNGALNIFSNTNSGKSTLPPDEYSNDSNDSNDKGGEKE